MSTYEQGDDPKFGNRKSSIADIFSTQLGTMRHVDVKLKCPLLQMFHGKIRMALQILRIAYGVLIVAIFFLPFGLYHTMAEPYVSGALWGFMLPVGYIAAASGIVVIFFPRFKTLRRLGLGHLLIVVGVSLMLSLLLYPKELSISLLHGTNMIDIDYSTFSGAVFWLSLLSIVTGIMIKITRLK